MGTRQSGYPCSGKGLPTVLCQSITWINTDVKKMLVMKTILCNIPSHLFSHQCVNKHDVDSLVQGCSNSSALAMELLQSCTKPSMWWVTLVVFLKSKTLSPNDSLHTMTCDQPLSQHPCISSLLISRLSETLNLKFWRSWLARKWGERPLHRITANEIYE